MSDRNCPRWREFNQTLTDVIWVYFAGVYKKRLERGEIRLAYNHPDSYSDLEENEDFLLDQFIDELYQQKLFELADLSPFDVEELFESKREELAGIVSHFSFFDPVAELSKGLNLSLTGHWLNYFESLRIGYANEMNDTRIIEEERHDPAYKTVMIEILTKARRLGKNFAPTVEAGEDYCPGNDIANGFGTFVNAVENTSMIRYRLGMSIDPIIMAYRMSKSELPKPGEGLVKDSTAYNMTARCMEHFMADPETKYDWLNDYVNPNKTHGFNPIVKEKYGIGGKTIGCPASFPPSPEIRKMLEADGVKITGPSVIHELGALHKPYFERVIAWYHNQKPADQELMQTFLNRNTK